MSPYGGQDYTRLMERLGHTVSPSDYVPDEPIWLHLMLDRIEALERAVKSHSEMTGVHNRSMRGDYDG